MKSVSRWARIRKESPFFVASSILFLSSSFMRSSLAVRLSSRIDSNPISATPTTTPVSRLLPRLLRADPSSGAVATSTSPRMATKDSATNRSHLAPLRADRALCRLLARFFRLYFMVSSRFAKAVQFSKVQEYTLKTPDTSMPNEANLHVPSGRMALELQAFMTRAHRLLVDLL